MLQELPGLFVHSGESEVRFWASSQQWGGFVAKPQLRPTSSRIPRQCSGSWQTTYHAWNEKPGSKALALGMREPARCSSRLKRWVCRWCGLQLALSCELDDAELILEVEMVNRLADSGKKTMKWGALKVRLDNNAMSARKAKDMCCRKRFQSGDIAYDTKAASPCRVPIRNSHCPMSRGRPSRT